MRQFLHKNVILEAILDLSIGAILYMLNTNKLIWVGMLLL